MKLAQRLAIVFFIAVFVVGPMFLRQPWSFWVEIVALAGLVVTIGLRVSGSLLGAFINERNLISLSRFQAVLWTVLIVGAFATILIGNFRNPAAIVKALNDTFSQRADLFALMGISYASAVGSGMVQANKASKDPDPNAVTAAQAKTQTPDASAQGVLYSNPSPKDAQFTDMFEGDELADAHLVDLSKVQMFFFTLVGAVVFISYAVGSPMPPIPQLPNTLIALMGISHGAYLGSKTVTKTPEAST